MKTLPILTLNTELRKHLDRWVPFLERERPDVICLQETCEDIVSDLAKRLGYSQAFAPRVRIIGEDTPEGIAILSRFPIIHHDYLIYDEGQEIIPQMTHMHSGPIVSGVLLAHLQADEREITVGTTHFTWSPMGQVNDYQRETFARMMSALEPYKELILCGDFNTPRGQELYDQLAQRFTDNIPVSEKSTVDPNLHRVKDLDLVVDGIFTTENYRVMETKLYDGLSDHKAIVAIIAT